MAQIFEHDESRTRERRKRIEARTQRSYRPPSPSPVTPIPRRASASSPGSARARVRHPRTYDTDYTEMSQEDCSRLPTVPRSATWQGEADEYEEENDQALIAEFSPFLPSSPSIDELDTVPPDDANLHRNIAPARLTDYAVSASSGVHNLQFPLDIAGPAQQAQAGMQFLVEPDNPFQLRGNGLRFPLELDEEPAQRSVTPRFPLEMGEGPNKKKSVTPGFPLEMGEFAHKGNNHVSSNRATFPVVWPDEREESPIERVPLDVVEVVKVAKVAKVAKNGHADISELATNPSPGLIQPHTLLALHNEPSYVDAVVEADTIMDDRLVVVPSQPTDIALYETRVEDIVDVALTARARQLLRHKGSVEDTPAFIHNPLDYMRWWLLYPGRLEFLFWLGGALLLGVVMCVVFVMTGLGLGWMSFGHLAH
jgi:hypothetical protein